MSSHTVSGGEVVSSTTSGNTTRTVVRRSGSTRKQVVTRVEVDEEAQRLLIVEKERLEREAAAALRAQQEAELALQKKLFEAQLLAKQREELAMREKMFKTRVVQEEIEVPGEDIIEEVITTNHGAQQQMQAVQQQVVMSAAAEEMVQVVKPRAQRRNKDVTRKMMIVEYESSESSSSSEDEERIVDKYVQSVERVQKIRKRHVQQVVYDESKELSLKAAAREADYAAPLLLKVLEDARHVYDKAFRDATDALNKQRLAIEELNKHLNTKKFVEVEIEEPYSEDEVKTVLTRVPKEKRSVQKKGKKTKEAGEETAFVRIQSRAGSRARTVQQPVMQQTSFIQKVVDAVSGAVQTTQH